MVEWCDRVLVLGFNCSRYDESDQSAFRRVVTRPKVKLEKKGTRQCARKETASSSLKLSAIWTQAIATKSGKAYGCCVERPWFPY